MSDNQTRIITVSEVTTKVFESGTQYKVKSTSGLSFKFYDKKKDGNNTVAFQQFVDMQIRPGSIVEVWYKEEQKEYQGKPYTDRLIASFREAKDKPVEVSAQTPKAPYKPNLSEPSYVPEAKDESFWDKKAYKQCLWGYWVEKYAPKVYEARTADGTLGQAEMETVWTVFKQIEKDADKRFATGWNKAIKTFGTDEPLPNEFPDTADDIASQIPF